MKTVTTPDELIEAIDYLETYIQVKNDFLENVCKFAALQQKSGTKITQKNIDHEISALSKAKKGEVNVAEFEKLLAVELCKILDLKGVTIKFDKDKSEELSKAVFKFSTHCSIVHYKKE